MSYTTIIESIPKWLETEGPESRIVLSSRVRLARNITDTFYAHRADEDTRTAILESVLDASGDAQFEKSNFFHCDRLTDVQKHVFIERHLISPAFALKEGARGVLVRENEDASVLVNEEDHVRIQTLSPGLNTIETLEKAFGVEAVLSGQMRFAYSEEMGYLTACPTNMGTGLRASVLIHLPALVLTKDIQRVVRSAGQLGLAVRGYYGEGSDVVGNLFQISNQTSLGKSEYEIVDALMSVVRQVIEYEYNAAETLKNEASVQVEDKIWRSIGILKTARTLSTHEFMNLSSAVRFGLFLELFDAPEVKILNDMLIRCQPGHVQESLGREMESVERDVLRAEMTRQRFVDVTL